MSRPNLSIVPSPSAGDSTPYAIPTRTELAIAYRCSYSPRFYARIGVHMDAEAFRDPRVVWILRACRAHYKDHGKGPDSAVVTLARLSRWCRANKLTEEEVDACAEVYDQIEDSGDASSDDALAAEIAPVIRRRREKDLIHAIMHRYGQHGDLAKLIDELAKVQRIGLVEMDIGTRLTGEVFDTIDRLRHVDRLSTGIADLDFQLEGGMGRSQLGVVMGDAKTGKSLFLVNEAGVSVLHGLNVAVVTVELDETTWAARLISYLTGVPVSEILRGRWQDAKRILDQLQQSREFGSFVVKEFPPFATTVVDLKEWLSMLEDRDFKYDVLVIDYADRMASVRPDASSYDAMREVYDGIRYFAVDKKIWVWTASQTKGGKHSGMDKLSDSRHKSRILDLCVELVPDEDGAGMTYRIVGNRHGPAGVSVGPLPTDFARARISPDAADHVDDMWGEEVDLDA